MIKKESNETKPFPKKIVNKMIKSLRKKGYSYREIQRIFRVDGYDIPSLGYISKILNNYYFM